MKTALLAAFCLLAPGCARKQEKTPGQLTVLRFENLTGNPAFDWMGRGAARQIAAGVTGATPADSYQVSAERERAIVGGAKRILHGSVSQSGGRLRLHADLEDPASRTFQSAESSGPVSEGIAPLAGAVARQIDPGANRSGAKNEAALAAFIGGLDATETGAAAESFSRAIAADPDFGPAYLALIEVSLARKDRDSGDRTLAAARARSAGFSPVDRARLDVMAAQMSGDPAALSKSLAALSTLTPSDRNLLRALGDAELAAKRYRPAIDYYKKALAAQPDDAALLNVLGYTQAYAGDLDGSVKTLQEYERVRPSEANPLDSLGDVNFYWGRFPEAEKLYRQAYEKDATFLNSSSLLKAAKARLMTGDLPGAEGVFAEYEAARRAAGDPVLAVARAQWDYQRGKRGEAIRELGAFVTATKVREAAALADCTLTMWLLESGDPAAAAKHTTCRFLMDPHAASFPNPAAQAYTLLLAKNFQGALPILRDIVARAAPNPNEPAPVLLAWALVETGHFDEAEKYLGSVPVPSVPAPAPFESLIVPRIFDLRAKIAERKGDHAAAERNLRLFQTLSAARP